MSRQIVKTPYFSFRIDALPRGCQLCVQGKKTVLFITGLCSRHCTYCPISDQKKDKDVVYVNEWPTKRLQDLFKEIELCDSEGVGITGGDPLVKIDRTVKYIKALKKRFGKKGKKHRKKFHIHLYTPLNLVDEKRLQRLFDAGLDEIRFHPDISSNKDWNRLAFAKNPGFNWKVGVEIPVIPGKLKETKKLIDFLAEDAKSCKIDFLNLNELELSDTAANKLSAQGFVSKDSISYGVKGSEETAKKLLQYCKSRKFEKSRFHVHYCTCRLKDAVQLAKRIKRRAKNVAKEYDYVDDEGLLIRGAVYGNLAEVKTFLRKQGVPEKLLEIQQKTKNHKKRILTSAAVVADFAEDIKSLKARCAIVKEYPTHDAMPIEASFL